MKTFEVILNKSYIIKIKAENEQNAKNCAEFFTSDICDISSFKDKQEYNFEIEEIDCKINESYGVEEVNV